MNILIKIGLTGWTDHPMITSDPKRKLENYSSHFPIVEIDSSFYAIPAEKNIREWIYKTPSSFKFIPKAYAAMTCHKAWDNEFKSTKQMFELFKKQFLPMYEEKRIQFFLFQFPPFFRFSQKNIDYLQLVHRLMQPYPIAIEFRHPSWFIDDNKDRTLRVLKDNHLIHTLVDQPQTPGNSTQKIIETTNKNMAFYRLHGRNYSGWIKGSDDPDWRKKRTLYEYSMEELTEIKNNIQLLIQNTEKVIVIFNNNSGFHAAKNAKELQQILNIEYENLNPRQLNLF